MLLLKGCKWIGILWISLFIFPSCGPESAPNALRIGFSQCTRGDEWRKEMEDAMRREMEFHPEFSLSIVDAHNDSEKQIRDIASLVDLGIDLLIVSPNEAAPITAVVERVMAMGIPVIILDRKTNSKIYTTYIGADNQEIGRTAANFIKTLRKTEDSTRILEIWGLQGSSPAQNRHKGFAEIVDQSPELNIVAKVAANWEADGVRAKLPQLLQSSKDFDVVFVHNDRMALAAYQLLREYRPEMEVDIIGVDGLSGSLRGMQLVEDGILTANLLYPRGGEEAIKAAVDILREEEVSKDIILQTTLIDQSNVRIMKKQAEKLSSQQKKILRQRKKINAQNEIYRDQTTAMYILIFSLMAALVLGGIVYSSLKAKQEVNLALERKNQEILNQKEQIEAIALQAREATQAKLKFFTNISHEFNKMRIQAAPYDILEVLEEIVEAFRETAGSRDIRFDLEADIREKEVWFDLQMVDKVLFNLLSNAFKFTPEGGSITVRLKEEDKQVRIQVEDNGRGMSAEHAAHAFDRFYQGENYQTQGTGLGLSLSQELIHLHRGKISVESQKGRGTRFDIVLQKGKDHFEEDELSLPLTQDDTLRAQWLFVEEDEKEKNTGEVLASASDHEPTLLLIEDHAELRQFLGEKLALEYQVYVAGDAESGIKLAETHIPDLIICDVMLPGLDGKTLTKAVKSSVKTSHIPIILLTAQSSIDQQIEGLQSGADLYLTKPFSLQFLKENIRNLIKNRELLRENFADPAISEQLNEKEGQEELSVDQRFVLEFKGLVAAHLGDSSFGVQDLCREIGLSRVQLYRKVKALMGCTITDYIKEMRLKRAEELLLKGELSISEIAYQVGFASPAYFSTAFKARYEVSPSEFIKNKQSTTS